MPEYKLRRKDVFTGAIALAVVFAFFVPSSVVSYFGLFNPDGSLFGHTYNASLWVADPHRTSTTGFEFSIRHDPCSPAAQSGYAPADYVRLSVGKNTVLSTDVTNPDNILYIQPASPTWGLRIGCPDPTP